MTEAEWLKTRSAARMLAHLGRRFSERKSRLFACAACRLLWERIEHPSCRKAIEVAERLADGQVTARQRTTAYRGANLPDYPNEGAQATRWCLDPNARVAARIVAGLVSRTRGAPLTALAAVLRDIFGNPFRPTTITPVLLAWSDGTIPKLAQAIYDERAFDRLPILADALEDAGGPEEMIAHLRSPGPHARGCWAVDLLLGKS
jgi:hypothetical protein